MELKNIYSSMEIKMKKISSLNAAEYNPRRITPGELKQLENDIVEFGFQKPITVNIHTDRMNVIVGGHQGLKILKKLGKKMAPCIEVNLSYEKERELNVKLNRSNGDWDFEIMSKYYDIDELKRYGFKDGELKSMMPTYDDLKTLNPDYPIVPKLSEKYDYVLVFATNEIDLSFLENFFELKKEKSYKSNKVGIGRVVEFSKFKKILDKWKK